MIKMYGIPNCDTIKKARLWLKDNNIDYAFHNYKNDGVPEDKLKTWIKAVGWEALLNKRGTTWRKLEDTIKNNMNEKSAIQIMLDNPSIIKRPIIDNGKHLVIGFSENEYRQLG